VMMDADCVVAPGSIDALVQQVLTTDRPAQACYLMERPTACGPREMVSALAFLVKNRVRPLGLRRLRLPCLLTGTGMAFPWAAISGAQLATGNIVEDMQLGLDLTLAGYAPLFCPAANVIGRLPSEAKVAYGQRTRWEHGHLQTLLTQVPRLFREAVRHRSFRALALGVELSVPPLALLMMSVVGLLVVSTVIGLLPGGSLLAAKLLAGGVLAVTAMIFAAWARFGRGHLPLAALLAAPLYMAWKVPMYAAFLFRRHTQWNRTTRTAGALPAADFGGGFEVPPVGARLDFNRDLPPQPAMADAGAEWVHQSFVNGLRSGMEGVEGEQKAQVEPVAAGNRPAPLRRLQSLLLAGKPVRSTT